MGKKLFLLVLFTLMTIMAMGVEAGTALNPTSSTQIRNESYVIATNTSINSSGGYNCSFSIISTSLSNATTSVLLGNNFTNTTSGTEGVNFKVALSNAFSTTLVEDASDYTVTTICSNSTNQDVTTATSVIVDNTAPTQPSSLLTTKQTSRSFSFTGTVNNPTTTGCSLDFESSTPLGNGINSCTQTTTSCSCAVTTASDYTYSYRLVAGDGLNITRSEFARLQVETSTGGGRSPAQLAQIQQAVAAKSSPARNAILGFFGKIGSFIRGLFG